MRGSGSRSLRRERRQDDLNSFAAFQAHFYPPLALPLLIGWLISNGWLTLWVGLLLAAVALVGAHLLIPHFVGVLLPSKVSPAGCGIAQFFYWGSPLLLGLLFWQGGSTLLVVGAALIPALVLLVALMASMLMRQGRRR